MYYCKKCKKVFSLPRFMLVCPYCGSFSIRIIKNKRKKFDKEE